VTWRFCILLPHAKTAAYTAKCSRKAMLEEETSTGHEDENQAPLKKNHQNP